MVSLEEFWVVSGRSLEGVAGGCAGLGGAEKMRGIRKLIVMRCILCFSQAARTVSGVVDGLASLFNVMFPDHRLVSRRLMRSFFCDSLDCQNMAARRRIILFSFDCFELFLFSSSL